MFKVDIHLFKTLKEAKITLASWFTITRVIMTPFIVAAMICNYWKSAFSLFVIAGLTDMVDGKIARYLNEQTLLGAGLDTLADKILMLACLFSMAFISSPVIYMPFWFVLLIVIREVLVVGGWMFLYFTKGFFQIKPTVMSKITGIVQTTFIAWLFACHAFQSLPITAHYSMLLLVTLLVFISLIQYIRIGFTVFTMEVS